LALLPEKKNLDLFTAFIQDEISLAKRLSLTVGTKVLHNAYTGIELQPSVRMAVAINNTNSLWAAVSRAVRTPSRLDADYYAPRAPQPATVPSIKGGPNFVSEKVIAYELGYRIQPDTKSSISLATFYNTYDDIYSIELLPGTFTFQTQNGAKAKSWGAELSAAYQLTGKWTLRGGYTYFDMDLKAKPGVNYDPSYLANDVRNQVFFQSMTDLPFNLHIDVIARYLDYLPATLATIKVPSYFTFDTRIAYTMRYRWWVRIFFKKIIQNLIIHLYPAVYMQN
jgi:iron complex outermembrane receptor protein